MFVYYLSGLDTAEWFRTKAEAIAVAEAMQEPGAPALELEKVTIGDPNKYTVVAYLNGRGFVIGRETVKTWPAVDYSIEGEGSGDWSEQPEEPIRVAGRGMRIIETGEL